MGILVEQEIELSELSHMIVEQMEVYDIIDMLDNMLFRLKGSGRKRFLEHCLAMANTHLPNKDVKDYIKGKVFVLSGDFDLGKRYWQKYIIDNGGIVKSTVNKNVSYLVVENGKLDGTSSLKERKADIYGVPTIDIQTLRKMK